MMLQAGCLQLVTRDVFKVSPGKSIPEECSCRQNRAKVCAELWPNFQHCYCHHWSQQLL